MAIALTYLEEWAGMPRNSVSLIDRHGEVLFTYAKVHTCDFSDECMLTPGDDFYVASLDTAAGPVQVGAMICYDREFPESARVLMLKGAELILVPNACDMELNRIAQLRTRATENMVAVALANYTTRTGNGHSIAFDPIAFTGGTEQVDGYSRDSLVVEAGGTEGVYLAPFDLDAIREYRQAETWGNAYRKPSRYAILTSTEVADPFVRPDSRR
jgi:predicted amidohydrolase